MTVDQLSQAIINAFVQGGEQFLEGTMAAALPLLWMLVIALLLARPYMVRTTQKFSLRLAADIWWILYVGLRDLMIALTAILSFMFLYPDVLVSNSLPIGGSLATAALFGALLVKLVADADNDPRAFKLVSTLLGAGSALYLVPTLLGVQLSAVNWGPCLGRRRQSPRHEHRPCFGRRVVLVLSRRHCAHGVGGACLQLARPRRREQRARALGTRGSLIGER